MFLGGLGLLWGFGLVAASGFDWCLVWWCFDCVCFPVCVWRVWTWCLLFSGCLEGGLMLPIELYYDFICLLFGFYILLLWV